jgi:hypothetical protein
MRLLIKALKTTSCLFAVFGDGFIFWWTVEYPVTRETWKTPPDDVTLQRNTVSSRGSSMVYPFGGHAKVPRSMKIIKVTRGRSIFQK